MESECGVVRGKALARIAHLVACRPNGSFPVVGPLGANSSHIAAPSNVH
jgi:hypothetical protein